MDQFDSSRPGAIPHAGTFNNNVATMAAGCVVLRRALHGRRGRGAHRARRAFPRGGRAVLGAPPARRSPVTGYGSMLRPLPRGRSGSRSSSSSGCTERGIYTAPRGMVNLSLPLTDDQLAAALAALDDTLAELAQSSPSQ